MSHFRLHTKTQKEKWQRHLLMGLVCLMAVGVAGYAVYSIGTAKAKSRETVLIYTEEEFEQYLLDIESEEYNLDGRYQLEENLDLSWLETSIGTNIEPFTGSFDGNGHIISGLERPLFGVLKDAKVERLFLSEAWICHPAVYSDGQHYVDGYAGLAAYSVNSVIVNCGMSGEIQTSSPSEAEYQLAKASPPEADEGRGPGLEEGAAGPGGEAGPGEGTSGSGGETGSEEGTAGPGGETGPGEGTSGLGGETGSEEGTAGPGSETESEEGAAGPGGETGSEEGTAGPDGGTETAEEAVESGDGTGTAGDIVGPEGETEAAEDIGPEVDDTSGGMESTEHKESEGGNTAGGAEGSEPETTEGNVAAETKESIEDGKESSIEGNKEESRAEESSSEGSTARERASGGSIAGGNTTEGSTVMVSGKGQTTKIDNIVPLETAGYRPVNRDQLMLKISAVTDLNAESAFTASPSDATPSNAENIPESGSTPEPGDGSQSEAKEPEESPEYIGNPNGDIYILVTAERVTVGGLVAETSGDTRISECFTLITLDSKLGDIETYSGGFAGILGAEAGIENSYATGLADSDGVTGGFVADNAGFIENCYSSMTIGEHGIIRGAFTAGGDGTISGCIYDRQMACTSEIETTVMTSIATPSEGEWSQESGLHGLNTIDMTGLTPQVPGTWHTADQAYPQIPYFAAHEEETIATNSSVSAIPLILPEGVTLINALNEGGILLPGEIEGQEVQWEAEGAIRIDENKQIVTEDNVTLSRHEAPEVGMSLDDQMDSGDNSSPGANREETDPEEANTKEVNSKETNLEEKGNEDVREEPIQTNRITASLGTVNKSFSVGAVRQNKAVTYTTWIQVGEELTQSGEITPPYGAAKILPPQQDADGYYEIYNATQLAWFSYNRRYTQSFSRNVKLKADIDLFGGEYTNCSYDAAADNIKEALLWTPLGSMERFDGENHVINHLYVNRLLDPLSSGNLGFMETTGAGIIKNLGLAGGLIESIEHAGSRTGTLAGYAGDCTIYNCWSNVDVLIKGKAAEGLGGIVGLISGVRDTVIDGCSYFGKIRDESTAANHVAAGRVGGIIGVNDDYYTNGAKLTTVRNCYNRGSLTSLNTIAVGGIVANLGKDAQIKISNCYNAGPLSGTNRVAGILAYNQGNAMVSNSYYDSQYASDTRATALDEATMKSWAFAYALNGQKMTQETEIGISWTYSSNPYEIHGGYPFPIEGELERPDSWQDIGKGINNGLITGYSMTSGSSGYPIQSAEQLAAFAAKVNDGETGASSILMSNLDLTGSRYSGTEENPILWIPIGTGKTTDSATNIYTGTFDGNGKIIGGMKVQVDGYAGLFGCVGGGAVIKKTGLDTTCSIEALSPGTSGLDGTAAFVGAVRYTGSAATQLTIEHCYTRASIQGKSIHTGSFLGRDESTAGENRITNCYATGEIATSLGSVKPGAIAGTFANGTGSAGTLMYCYWDEGVESHYSGGLTIVGQGSQTAADSGKQQAGYMKTDPFLNKMNTGLSAAIWERDDSKNNGYPIFTGLTVYTSWEGVGAVAAEPATAAAGTKGTAANPYLIKSAEDLAWFAHQVNVNGNTGICGKLVADISLFGGLYTGGNGYDSNDNEILSRALLWVPVGSDTAGKRYTGTFDGNGHVISKMRVKGTEKQGLFGTLGTSADIRKTAVATSLMEVDSAYAGGIAGYVNGTGVTVTECGNRGNLTGKGDFFGGAVGGIETGGNLVLDGCYNGAGGIIITTGVYAGGVLGGAGSGTVTIRNCYNRGKVEGQTYAGGIAGWIASNAQTIAGSYNAGQVTGTGGRFQSIAGSNSGTGNITNCYYQTGCPADPSAEEVSEAGLKTWGAAFVLNGEQLGQSTGISWSYTEGDYPVPGQISLRDAASWEDVGEAVYYGLLDGAPAASPYQIETAEQLAWFAYRVNNIAGDSAIEADLTEDIDMTATESRYVSSGSGDRLGWVPIGKDFSLSYKGVFGEGNQRIYEIQNLYVKVDEYAGLFGVVSENVKVMRTGLTGCRVAAWGISSRQYAGGIAGYVTGKAVLSQCYNRSGGEVTGGGTNSDVYPYIGGIVGTMKGNAVLSRCYTDGGCTIKADGVRHGIGGGIAGAIGERVRLEDSYCMDSTVMASGQYGGAAGGIVGEVMHDAVLSNSYSACSLSGSITTSTGTSFGGVVGGCTVGATPDTNMKNCYSEDLHGTDENYGVKQLGTTDAARQSDVFTLNTLDGNVRTGTARVWYTSLKAEETRGLPTFRAPVTVAVSFVPDTPEAGSQVSLPGNLSVADMKLRAFGSVDSTFTPGSAAAAGDGITLTAYTGLTGADSDYHKYGYTNANQKLAFKAGGKDLLGLAGSLNDPTTDLGTVSSVSLGRAAAYTKPGDRYVLLEGASGTDRYEVQITVKGVTSKTLSVTMPVEVAMAQLTPDGTDHVDYSAALNIKNNNAYPIDGKIVGVTPRSGNGYVPLKPVLGTLPKNREITDASGGVRLGLANQSGSSTPLAANIYYDPAAVASGKSWLGYRLKHGGSLPYRYVMEYSGLHFSGAVDKFAYDISYGFAVSESDYTDTADVIVTP